MFARKPRDAPPTSDPTVGAVWVGEVTVTEGQRVIAGNVDVARTTPTGTLIMYPHAPMRFYPNRQSAKKGYTMRGFHWHETVTLTETVKGTFWVVKTPDGTFTAKVGKQTSPLVEILQTR
jgi:hypothetical protein